MKTILNFILMAVTAQAAYAADIIFESKNEKVLILEKTIQWISKKTDSVEIGTTSGIFEIKGGSGDPMFWVFVYEFELDPNEILWKSLILKKDLKENSKGIISDEEMKYRDSLMKWRSERNPLNDGMAGSLIAHACADDDFQCGSIEFKPHDH